MAPLRLYVWGPAFGLASLDAECLAAIAFLARTLSSAEYRLIRSSPSAVPTQHLPALYDPSTDSWICGYTTITSYLHDQRYPSQPRRHERTKLTPAEADRAAYTAFLTAHAAPLLAVYLYVSSANYGAVTRPAFSAALSFPLPWIEPPAVRAAMTRRAAHLGMSSLDTDSVSPGELGGKDMAQDPTLPAGHPVFHARNAPVSSALAPEQRSRIRLETLAGEVFKILSSADWQSDREQLPDVRCVAYAYLALMAAPGVPRPWLREILEGRYEPLHRFMLDFQKETFPEGTEALPWAEGEENTPGAVSARFARGVLFQVPGVGTLWRRWWASRKRKQLGIQTKSGRGGFLVLIGASLGLTVVGVGVWFYRTLHPFGAAVQVWRKPLIPNGFGAAGLVLGALYGMT